MPDVLAEIGLAGPIPVTAVGSHDTASAVVGVPAASERFAYISCGTWSLVGVELDQPVLTEESRAANFTNEVGIDATVRYLRNVMGLWLLQECLRTWRGRGSSVDLDALLRDAAKAPAFGCVIDPDDPVFLAARRHARAHRRVMPPDRSGPTQGSSTGRPLHRGQSRACLSCGGS